MQNLTEVLVHWHISIYRHCSLAPCYDCFTQLAKTVHYLLMHTWVFHALHLTRVFQHGPLVVQTRLHKMAWSAIATETSYLATEHLVWHLELKLFETEFQTLVPNEIQPSWLLMNYLCSTCRSNLSCRYIMWFWFVHLCSYPAMSSLWHVLFLAQQFLFRMWVGSHLHGLRYYWSQALLPTLCALKFFWLNIARKLLKRWELKQYTHASPAVLPENNWYSLNSWGFPSWVRIARIWLLAFNSPYVITEGEG